MSLKTIATGALLLAATSLSTANDYTHEVESEPNDLMMQRMEALLERRLAEQRDTYERRLEEQKLAYESQINDVISNVAAVSEMVNPTDPAELRRRFLSTLVDNIDDYSGLTIKRDKAGISMGADSDVRVLRTGLCA